MSTTTCPDCHHDVSKSAYSCPHCGRRLPGASKSPVRSVIRVFVILSYIYPSMLAWSFYHSETPITIGTVIFLSLFFLLPILVIVWTYRP